MSCEDYCPEVHNDPDFEVVDCSDTSSSETEGMDCGQCFDCSTNKDCIAKKNEEDQFDKDLSKGGKINEMIKKEMADKMKVPDKTLHPSWNAVKDVSFKDLPDDAKIKLVAKAFWDTGGIEMENILELKMLMVLIGATEQLEGFKDFPREQVYKLLEMIIYHANKHMEILNV